MSVANTKVFFLSKQTTFNYYQAFFSSHHEPSCPPPSLWEIWSRFLCLILFQPRSFFHPHQSTDVSQGRSSERVQQDTRNTRPHSINFRYCTKIFYHLASTKKRFPLNVLPWNASTPKQIWIQLFDRLMNWMKIIRKDTHPKLPGHP